MKNKYLLPILIILLVSTKLVFSQLQIRPVEHQTNEKTILSDGKEVLGYNVYKNDIKINQNLLSELEYSDTVNENSACNYYVTAVYEEGESGPSNIANIIVNLNKLEKHYIIMEDATGTWCNFCPGAAMGIDELIENDKKVLALAYHVFDDYENSYSVGRAIDYYGVQGYPYVILDGVQVFDYGSNDQSLYSTYLPYYEERIEVPTMFDLAISGSTSGDGYSGTVIIEKVNENISKNLKLMTALVENNIEEEWQGQTELNAVVRKMFPNAIGNTVELSTGNTQSFDFTFSWNPEWNSDNFCMVAFIQDIDTKEILQANKLELNSFTEAKNNAKSARNETLFTPYNVDTERNIYSTNVHITWEAPGDDRWMFYGNGRNKTKVGSEDEPLTFDIASLWGKDDILPLDGMAITKIEAFLVEESCNYTLKIWTGEDGNDVLIDSTWDNVNAKQWNTIEFESELKVDITKPLWIGIHNENTESKLSAGCDAGPAEVGKGDKFRKYEDGNPGEWINASTMGIDANWNIKIFVEPAEISSHVNLSKPILSVFPNPTSSDFTVNSDQIIDNIYVVDINGKIVYNNSPKANSHHIDIQGVKPGIYFVKIMTIKGYQFEKIVFE